MSTSLKPQHRRPEFDEISTGWGADALPDLRARCELLDDFWAKHGGLTQAERKIADAMLKRLRGLGDNEFSFNRKLPEGDRQQSEEIEP